ncbi:MAG: hypothetical protein KUG68_06210, partial [Flavobacteriaceae bacterium]|nr:hypothetical protein [Flavobacteriaceae bacterium]
SGLLSNLDLYRYLKSQNVFSGKKAVFIEILNSKELYIGHVLKGIIDNKKNNINHLIYNEFETDNITADIQTGFNLDKIPRYLDDFLKTTSKKDKNLDFIQLYMPHKISMNDVENHLRGELDSLQFAEIKVILKNKNDTIDLLTEGSDPKGFNDSWKTYEPTLSRHLSKSSLVYIDSILKHKELIKLFTKIDLLTDIQKDENNK